MGSLALFYYQVTRSNQQTFDRAVLAALAFSGLGDILLLFVEQQAQGMLFFAAGLGSFLLAHLAYIYSFWIFPPAKKIQTSFGVALFFISLAVLLLSYLWQDIPSALRIPVTVYALTICTMGIAAFGMNKKVLKVAGLWLILGALCFILSDSLIAINKFKSAVNIWQPRLSIMFTYILAQWLLINGIIRGRAELNLTIIPTSPNGNQ